MNHPFATEDHGPLQALLTTIDLPSLLDHQSLDPLQGGSALREQLEAARFWGCGGFCIPSGWVRKARPHLPPNGPKLVAVVG
ncbi:MAG TPA: hypothetical protein DD643_03690, partial [Synechococcus sp. UBA8638]|nr:hypothetical protein [Synechococcus sp. UBA8638]